MPMLEDDIRKLPCWNGAIEITPLQGGLSNINFKVKDANGIHVVRFGDDFPFHHVSRDYEVKVARAAHAAGFAPEVTYADRGVMVTRYIESKTLTARDVGQQAARIGALMQHFHTTMPHYFTGTAQMFWVFHVIRDYARTLLKENSPHAGKLAVYMQQAAALEAAQISMPIVFGHHDLLPANFLDDGEKLWLIDFEYAAFGTAMFDLAGIASNAQIDEGQQNALLSSYFSATPAADFLKSNAAMQCASLLRETLWAMVSNLFLAAPGVDYEAYTLENVSRYESALEGYQWRYGKLKI